MARLRAFYRAVRSWRRGLRCAGCGAPFEPDSAGSRHCAACWDQITAWRSGEARNLAARCETIEASTAQLNDAGVEKAAFIANQIAIGRLSDVSDQSRLLFADLAAQLRDVLSFRAGMLERLDGDLTGFDGGGE